MMKIFLLLIISILWRLGGTNKKAWCRDVIIPILLGLYVGYFYSWIVGFFTIGAFQIIRMGYGAYDPEHDDKPSLLGKLTRDKEGWVIRGVVGLLYGICGLIPLFIYWLSQGLLTDIFLIKWASYAIGNMLIGGIFCKLKARDIIIEPAIGAGVGSLIFLF